MIRVLHKGDEFGNDMIVKIRLSSGREIFAFATRNTYGGDWDLGPTWNYLVLSDRPFLVDTGRRGMGTILIQMIESLGFKSKNLDSVLLSHGHEDHDGGVFEIVKETGAKVMANAIYSRLIQTYPEHAPSGEKESLPASCWRCLMPEAFVRENCLSYHKERQRLHIEDLESPLHFLEDGIKAIHVPGHSPDSIALFIDEEALLAGDTILPDITPHISLEESFLLTKDILPSQYIEAQQLYGLRCYLKSLKTLKALGKILEDPFVLPAHRLYYNNRWNHVRAEERIDTLIEHHIQRCSDILDILSMGPSNPGRIAREYFDAKLLEGFGMNLAVSEVLSHCELLRVSKDVVFGEEGKIQATGGIYFESVIRGLEGDERLFSDVPSSKKMKSLR